MKEIQIVNGKGVAVVDDADYEAVSAHRWYNHGGGYVTTIIRGKVVLMHRFLMDAKPGEVIDHRNGDRRDNRRENLRRCNMSQNCANSKAPSTNSSGFKGVYWHKKDRRYMARIKVDYKYIYLGQYKDPVVAARVYDAAARKYFGEFAKTNFEAA